jgi:hypothetical protein
MGFARDGICCCCCITGLPSLGCVICSSLKLRRIESNAAEPFAIVYSRCAIVSRAWAPDLVAQ